MANKLTINVIQNLPTPHNNVLLKYLLRDKRFKVNLWYAKGSDSKYPWKKSLANQYKKSMIFGK